MTRYGSRRFVPTTRRTSKLLSTCHSRGWGAQCRYASPSVRLAAPHLGSATGRLRRINPCVDPLLEDGRPTIVVGLHIVDSARPRGGRRFEPVQELALEQNALEAALAIPGAHRGLLVLREPTGPFGVPDLLAVVGPPGRLAERRALTVPPLLNQVDAGVVAAAAPSARRTVETIARRVGWPLDTVQRRLPELLRTGALARAGRESYVRPAALRPVGRLYAIETKVRDWKRAVRQARTYSTWCDSYVIVMASVGVGSLDQAIDEVRMDGGGLMLAGDWLLRPRLGARSPAQRLWGSEHLFAATLAPEGSHPG